MAQAHQQERRSGALTSASRVGLSYLAAGVVWILLSDALLATLVRDPQFVARIQTFKGWAFVAASAVLIWWLVRREVRRVQHSEGRFAALLDQNIAGMYVIASGHFVQVNRRLAEIFGYTVEEASGMPVGKLLADEDRERVLQSIRDRETGVLDLAHHRFRGVRADGTRVEVEVFGRAVDWGGGRAVAGILLDVTDRVHLEEKLRQAARVDALGSLTGTVAHDFNNFLTGIIGNLDLMLSDPDGESRDLRANLELVRDSATRAAALTSQLLTFGRGRIFQHRPIDPNRHLRKLAFFLESLCQGGQTLVLDLDDSVPAVTLDPVALDQLVVNLFVNAKDAVGDRGTITVRTRVARVADGPTEVAFEVSDDGVGMPSEVRDRIFEPFFTTKERGTGLGLASVRSIVDEVRGHLTVESEPGAGTTVRVALPASKALPGVPARPGSATLIPFAPSAKSAAVLVVDDDHAVRKVIAAALTRVGHRVLTASSATEAHRAIADLRGEVDLVVCDVNLADESGPEFVAAVLEQHPHVRVLFMSGSRRSEAAASVAMLRSTPFLGKPFSLEKLRDAVERALRGGDELRSGQSGP